MNTVDIEDLVVTMLDEIEEADNQNKGEIVFRFNSHQIRNIAEAYRKVDWIEIY